MDLSSAEWGESVNDMFLMTLMYIGAVHNRR